MSGEDVRSTRHPVISLLLILIVVFVGFALIGPLIGFLITKPYVQGTFEDYLNALQNLSEHPELKIQVYVLQGCSTLVGLIVAPMMILSGQKKNITEFFGLTRLQIVPITVTVFVVIAFMLVNSVFIAWNANVHFPEFMHGFEEWAKAKEKLAEETTRMLTQFDSVGELLLAILVIALLPAIGEELVFRGMIQNEFYRGTKNIHLSIWVSAILFSAIHMQFFGFVPRLLLGALFGYLYHWSGQLSIAIVAHFVNNAFQVLMLYVAQGGYVDKEIVESNDVLPWPGVAAGTVATILLLHYFHRYYQTKEIIS